VSTALSRYIDKKPYRARYAEEQTLALKEARARAFEYGDEAEWLRCVREDLPQYIPFLTQKCGMDFRGRVLEIGAGAAWMSAELSKLPKVVEVMTTDHLPALLKEYAPRVFAMLSANTSKIIRTPSDFHRLDFPDNYFDFVVGSAVLHHADNIVQVLREAKRVLKPGGQFVAIREPVWPLVKVKSRTKMLEKLVATGINQRFYTLADYKEFFRQASLPLEVKKVNLAQGFKYYLNEVVNGLTHARYAFVGIKRGSATASRVGGAKAAKERR
jgi:ubiquinone/menaquinone biosynthesis C-methylase UbiE